MGECEGLVRDLLLKQPEAGRGPFEYAILKFRIGFAEGSIFSANPQATFGVSEQPIHLAGMTICLANLPDSFA